MPHGGKRPGAGAPRGNLNGLKHGRNSPRLREIALALAAVPSYRDFIIARERGERARRRRAQRIAARLLLDFLERTSATPKHLQRSVARLKAALTHPPPKERQSSVRRFVPNKNGPKRAFLKNSIKILPASANSIKFPEGGVPDG